MLIQLYVLYETIFSGPGFASALVLRPYSLNESMHHQRSIKQGKLGIRTSMLTTPATAKIFPSS